MGVRGLKSFIRKNDDLLIKDHKLHDTIIVVDACNLVSELIRNSQKHERPDLFGGNMVQFGSYVNRFFQTLSKCNIMPILVFDGAQTSDVNKNKTREKQRRALEIFQNVMSINKLGFGDFILPVTATNVFRSIAVDKRIQIIQCMYEADMEVARIANKYKCPVLSNDSDFYLIDLPFGLIPTDLLYHELILIDAGADRKNSSNHYIMCDIYMQDNFTNYFPSLDKRCLPMLAILAGNDFINPKVFERFCSQLPFQRIRESYGMKGKTFRKVTTKQHEKILKILYYLCDKNLEETVNQVCLKSPKENRPNIKKIIKSNLVVYDIPTKDNFEDEFMKIYKSGFRATYHKKFHKEEMDSQFRESMREIIRWFRKAMERSVLSYRCLELVHRNKVFLRSYMDDSNLPSAHICQMKPIEVMLSLLRSSHHDSNKPCTVYDRISKTSYGKIQIYPCKILEKFGPLNHLIYDLPTLSEEIRQTILMATFHASIDDYSRNLINYDDWLETTNAQNFMIIKILLRFIDIENPKAKLWTAFKKATLMCYIYYYAKFKNDARLTKKVDNSQFLIDLSNTIEKYRYTKTPQLSKKRLYNCRLMHQISQLQTSIMSFNLLNAFFGDVMTRIRSENWLNSCLIYNLTENLRMKRLTNLEALFPPIVMNN